MDSTTWNPGTKALSEKEVESLVPTSPRYEAFQALPDPRRGQSKRYKLALLLCLLVWQNSRDRRL